MHGISWVSLGFFNYDCNPYTQEERKTQFIVSGGLINWLFSFILSWGGIWSPHYHPIEVDKDYHLRLHQGNFDAEMSLSPDSLAELHWWVNNIGAANKKVSHASPDVILYTDASGAGWEAKLESGISTCGIWSHDESVKHINCLELLAIHLALLSLFKNRSNIHVRIMCDNTTAVSYINEMGGCKSLECNAIAKMIWSWAITKGIWLSASHISGSVNVDADNLSCNLNLNLEWMLSANTFQKIITVYGQPVDSMLSLRIISLGNLIQEQDLSMLLPLIGHVSSFMLFHHFAWCLGVCKRLFRTRQRGFWWFLFGPPSHFLRWYSAYWLQYHGCFTSIINT